MSRLGRWSRGSPRLDCRGRSSTGDSGGAFLAAIVSASIGNSGRGSRPGPSIHFSWNWKHGRGEVFDAGVVFGW